METGDDVARRSGDCGDTNRVGAGRQKPRGLGQAAVSEGSLMLDATIRGGAAGEGVQLGNHRLVRRIADGGMGSA